MFYLQIININHFKNVKYRLSHVFQILYFKISVLFFIFYTITDSDVLWRRDDFLLIDFTDMIPDNQVSIIICHIPTLVSTISVPKTVSAHSSF